MQVYRFILSVSSVVNLFFVYIYSQIIGCLRTLPALQHTYAQRGKIQLISIDVNWCDRPPLAKAPEARDRFNAARHRESVTNDK